MSTDHRDGRHPLEVLLAESGVTNDTFDTPQIAVDTTPYGEVSEVSEVTPSLDQQTVCEMAGFSEASWHRYHREYRHALICGEGVRDGRTIHLCASANVEFFQQIKVAKNAKQREGIAATQIERIAQLSAGVNGGRRAAEQIRRELRALAESGSLPSVPKRIAALLEKAPSLRKARPMQQLVVYYATYHVTTDLVQLDGMEAPPVGTVERAFRRCR